jgi:hypothetical protein
MGEYKSELKIVASDPFDPVNLRLDQSFVETSGVRKLLTTVPVRKPNNQDFIRVHPGEDYRLAAAVIELKEDREVYLVLPTVAAQLPGECVPVILFTGINRQGVVFLWPVKLPTPDGKINEWHRSATGQRSFPTVSARSSSLPWRC